MGPSFYPPLDTARGKYLSNHCPTAQIRSPYTYHTHDLPQVLLDETVPDLTVLSDQNHSRRVLLLSERRSGGQVVGGVLNADPRVFYVGDPCRMGGGPEALDGPNCVAVVSRLLACQPTINDIRNLFSFSYLLEHVRQLKILFSYGTLLRVGAVGGILLGAEREWSVSIYTRRVLFQ